MAETPQTAAEQQRCQLCDDVLTIACNEIKKPQYCDIRDRYQSNPKMDASDVSYELGKIETPQDHQYIVKRLAEIGYQRKSAANEG